LIDELILNDSFTAGRHNRCQAAPCQYGTIAPARTIMHMRIGKTVVVLVNHLVIKRMRASIF